MMIKRQQPKRRKAASMAPELDGSRLSSANVCGCVPADPEFLGELRMKRLFLGLLLGVGLAGQALADQLFDAYKACTEQTEPDSAISGCTVLLQSPRLRPEMRYQIFDNRGSAFVKKGDRDRAIADYNEAFRLQPHDYIVLLNLGKFYLGQPDPDRSLPYLNEAIQLEPSNAEAYRWRGVAYSEKGDYERAIRDYDQAILLKPDYAAAMKDRDRDLAALASRQRPDPDRQTSSIAKDGQAPASRQNPAKKAAAKPLAPLLKGDFAAEVLARIEQTKEYGQISSLYDARSRADPNWASSVLGRRADALLDAMRADALSTRPVMTADGSGIQYSAGDQLVTDPRISVQGLNTDKEYREFVAGSIAAVISAARTSAAFMAELGAGR